MRSARSTICDTPSSASGRCASQASIPDRALDAHALANGASTRWPSGPQVASMLVQVGTQGCLPRRRGSYLVAGPAGARRSFARPGVGSTLQHLARPRLKAYVFPARKSSEHDRREFEIGTRG